MSDEIPKLYEPQKYEPAVYERWLAADAFAAVPDGRAGRYVIMMPLPNVTGALHMGHAMDNVMQDLLIRWHRMMGDNTLWMPGTDHAGIATQAVVEKRLFELEGKTRHDLGREGLVARIWAWKDEYQERIIRQQQSMGCSCDWKRQRFTMDAVCARAVREAFFRLFRDGLIYRGNRLVNWDCQLQTAVSDDEIVHEKVQGHFWHLRYPVIDPRPGEPEYVVVATTRPETMLGDTAVAVHPDPAGELRPADRRAAGAESTGASPRRAGRAREAELEAPRGRADESPAPPPAAPATWPAPAARSGCRSSTGPSRSSSTSGPIRPSARAASRSRPAHDPNDYEVWERHKSEIGIVNILNPDGTLNANAGPYAGLDRFEARGRVVADLEARGLVESVEDREIEIGHSDRSKTPIEPYLSKQWFVRMGDVPGGIVCGAGTKKEFKAAGLAQAAIDAVGRDYESPSGRRLTFAPDHERYGGTYRAWLAEKRDWCISRQLWWGHRIPDLARRVRRARSSPAIVGRLPQGRTGRRRGLDLGRGRAVADPSAAGRGGGRTLDPATRYSLLVCFRDEAAEKRHAAAFEALGLVQDPDVLDTWFSSALWPLSTLGWPDPATAAVDPGQRTLAADPAAGRRRLPRLLLSRLLPRHRPRHHHPVGRPDDAHGPLPPGRRAVHRLVHPRQHPGRQGRADVQEQGQRHRPRGHHREIRRRRHALRPVRHADRDAGHPPAGPGRLALHRRARRPGRGEARPVDLHLHRPEVGQGVRRPRDDARHPAGQDHQRALRDRPGLLHQAVERGPLHPDEPGRARVRAGPAGAARARGPLDPVAAVADDRRGRRRSFGLTIRLRPSARPATSSGATSATGTSRSSSRG